MEGQLISMRVELPFLVTSLRSRVACSEADVTVPKAGESNLQIGVTMLEIADSSLAPAPPQRTSEPRPASQHAGSA